MDSAWTRALLSLAVKSTLLGAPLSGPRMTNAAAHCCACESWRTFRNSRAQWTSGSAIGLLS